MKQYQELPDGRTWKIDNSCIPDDPNNTDRATMLAEIEAGEAEVIAYVEPEPDYAELRRAAYGDWGNQLDMQFWDSVDGTTTWVDHVARVKAAHPKP